MVAIFSIMALIALISIYDYVSSRRWQQVTADDRNDLVFASRNREYGAYQIRKGYNKQLMLILGCTVFAIGSAYGIYALSKQKPKENVAPPEVLAQLTMDAPEIEEPLDPPVQQEVPELEKTIQFVPPVVTDDRNEANIPPAQNQFDNAAAGTQNQEGDGVGNIGGPPPPPPPPPPTEDNTVYTFVDEQAEFPGGHAALKKYLAENIKYPQTAIEMGIEGTTYVQFIISKKGNVSNVKVVREMPDCPECDKEAVRVVKGMPTWKPGKKDGKEVNQTYNLPVKFKLN